MARLLPPESAGLSAVAKEVGVSVQTLERWREEAQTRPARGRAWSAGARLEAVIVSAALDEAGKSAWCRGHGMYPAELDKWRQSATTALAEPEEVRASPQATRQDKGDATVDYTPEAVQLRRTFRALSPTNRRIAVELLKALERTQA